MAGIANVATEFRSFLDLWGGERKHLPSAISLLDNGFESWLKFEFYFWLIERRGLEGSSDLGVEYKVAVDKRWADMDISHKQCDLWIRDSDEQRYHFIELKAPFANANQGKMFSSAANDYWYMTRLKGKEEMVATGSVIIMGVGFKDESAWLSRLDSIEEYTGYVEKFSRDSGNVPGVEGLRWAVVTMHY